MRLGDAAVERLQEALDWPDLSATRYEPLDVLGRGGMGTVYRAHDRELGREVAVKVMRGAEAGSDTAERLLREARVLARLEHPGLVPVAKEIFDKHMPQPNQYTRQRPDVNVTAKQLLDFQPERPITEDEMRRPQ